MSALLEKRFGAGVMRRVRMRAEACAAATKNALDPPETRLWRAERRGRAETIVAGHSSRDAHEGRSDRPSSEEE
jgi:hypothetical protein